MGASEDFPKFIRYGEGDNQDITPTKSRATACTIYSYMALFLVSSSAQGGVERTVRIVLTKNPACTFSCTFGQFY